MGYTTPYYPHGIYHSILSSWDIPLHIILMHSITYYPHGRITPLSQYSYILLLACKPNTLYPPEHFRKGDNIIFIGNQIVPNNKLIPSQEEVDKFNKKNRDKTV